MPVFGRGFRRRLDRALDQGVPNPRKFMETSAVLAPRRNWFLGGVFLITASVLVFQIVQTRVLSVIAWYYLAFFAISVAMLGMTAGAVWVYLRQARHRPEQLASTLADFALATAIAMPASLIVQFCLITSLAANLITLASWTLMMVAMAIPYFFAGIAVSLALTRSPFPVSQVYGVDLLGAAVGCVSVVGLLNVLTGPSTIVFAGLVSALAAWCFSMSAPAPERERAHAKRRFFRPLPVTLVLAALLLVDSLTPIGLRPLMVKDHLEPRTLGGRYEKWNSYSRIVANRPSPVPVAEYMWSPSTLFKPPVPDPLKVGLHIDGAAGTVMPHYDGTKASIEYLRYDMVNLAYNLPGLRKSAVVGVGGGRDVLSAHLFGVPEIVGVELNPIFIKLQTEHPFYKAFSGVTTLPNLRLYVDDARSWFASSQEHFDLIQMSMIDTWAATGAGAFSLSENGLYTLEGWRTFLGRLSDGGVFTVSRWYSPSDLNETGRMIALATAATLDAGHDDARPNMLVARSSNIATLVLAKRPFTAEQLKILEDEVARLQFDVLLSPNVEPKSELLASIVRSRSIEDINRVAASAYLDLSVPTDNRPFFFNQLRFSEIPNATRRTLTREAGGVVTGNLFATIVLGLILLISALAVVGTIVVPLRGAARDAEPRLVLLGTLYFSLIGLGFMFSEISLLQYFSVYLGHPVYSLGVCLFSLILASGIGSLVSGRFPLGTPRALAVWGLLVGGYLIVAQHSLTQLFHATAAWHLPARIGVALAVLMPLGLLLGFAFPTGMRLIEAVDRKPTPWFWGINGATGVLASVLAIVIGIAFGINVTMVLAAVCYLALIPTALGLLRISRDLQSLGASAVSAGSEPPAAAATAEPATEQQ